MHSYQEMTLNQLTLPAKGLYSSRPLLVPLQGAVAAIESIVIPKECTHSYRSVGTYSTGLMDPRSKITSACQCHPIDSWGA